MPIRKFEDLDAAREALWTSRDDPELGARIRRLWERSRRLLPPGACACPGVQRFASIEQANEEREERTRRRVRALRERRRRG